jgi:plastocyanin
MKSFILVLVAFIVGLLVGVWYVKQHAPVDTTANPPTDSSAHPNHIRFVVEGNTKVDLSPIPGDIITWVNTAGQPVTVNVTAYAGLANLCDEASPTSQCTVLAPSGIFPYACSTPGLCFDPGVSPGKSPGHFPGPVKHPTLATQTISVSSSLTPTPASVQVACTGGTATATPASYTVGANTNVEWIAGPGVTGYVTLQPPNICSNQGSKTQYAVNVDGCVVVKSVDYPIHLDGCSTDGHGSITLQ